MSKKLFFTPGPAQLFYTVEQHIKNALKEDVASISHRSKQFQNIFASTVENLKTLLNVPDNFKIVFTASATEIWERSVQNLVEESSHHFVNGSFSKRFYDIAKSYKINASIEDNGFGSPFSLEIPGSPELIAVTQNETSIGFGFPQNEIYKIREANPDALLAADLVSCTPAVPIDFTKIDMAYFSVQKSFGLPAGLGVWILNERCIKKASKLEEKGHITGSYHTISQLLKYAEKNQTPETPNVLNIYLLGKVAEDMIQRGLKQIQNDTIYKSTILYQFMESAGWIKPFIQDSKFRSHTVAVGELEGVKPADLINYGLEKSMVIGSGYGPFKESHVRIANFPTHSKEQIEMLVDYLAKFQ
ncbi:MAG: aminotransferase class V-fold PLP-dependent enzyme [bacterium]|nr:aminotransferase class V-fold PLP-dependent enzyme [bacterium]